VIFQRRPQIGRLLSPNEKRGIATSIDPYFFRAPSQVRFYDDLPDSSPDKKGETPFSSLWLQIVPALVLLSLLAFGILVWQFALRKNALKAACDYLQAKSRGPVMF